MMNKILSHYHNNGIIYLPDFLELSSLQSIHNEIEQGTKKAEDDLRKNWNNAKTCFYSKNAVKSATPQQDYVTQPYFLASRDKAHIFYEEIENVLAVNRIGHGLHLLPEFKTIQDMTYNNDRLTSLLKTIGFIRPVCQLSVYIPKYPNSIGSEVNPHQESTFAHTQPQSVVVLWIALEDACVENACMWGIMGSHKWPLQYVSRVDHINKTRHFERVNDDIQIPDFKSQKDYFTPLEVKAGDAILFHGNFVHCSPANQSARSRKALSLQFIETFNVSYSNFKLAAAIQPQLHIRSKRGGESIMMYNKIEFFQNYFARATEKKLVVDSLAPRLSQLSDDLHILDLGCHDGALLKSIFEGHQSCASTSVKITAVDPSETAITELTNSDFARRYKISTYIGTAESYFAHHHAHYDWILASQCLYWSKDLTHIVSQIHQASDAALIVLRGKKGIYDIQRRFKAHLGNAQEQLYTAEDIENTLISLDVAYKRVNHTTHIVLPEPDTDAFKGLTGFFLQNENIEDDVDTLTQIKNYILQHSVRGLLEHEVAFFWLGKFL